MSFRPKRSSSAPKRRVTHHSVTGLTDANVLQIELFHERDRLRDEWERLSHATNDEKRCKEILKINCHLISSDPLINLNIKNIFLSQILSKKIEIPKEMPNLISYASTSPISPLPTIKPQTIPPIHLQASPIITKTITFYKEVTYLDHEQNQIQKNINNNLHRHQRYISTSKHQLPQYNQKPQKHRRSRTSCTSTVQYGISTSYSTPASPIVNNLLYYHSHPYISQPPAVLRSRTTPRLVSQMSSSTPMAMMRTTPISSTTSITTQKSMTFHQNIGRRSKSFHHMPIYKNSKRNTQKIKKRYSKKYKTTKKKIKSGPIHELPSNLEYLTENTIIRLANKKLKHISNIEIGDKILSLSINSYPKNKSKKRCLPIAPKNPYKKKHKKKDSSNRSSADHNNNITRIRKKKSDEFVENRKRSRTITTSNSPLMMLPPPAKYEPAGSNDELDDDELLMMVSAFHEHDVEYPLPTLSARTSLSSVPHSVHRMPATFLKRSKTECAYDQMSPNFSFPANKILDKMGRRIKSKLRLSSTSLSSDGESAAIPCDMFHISSTSSYMTDEQSMKSCTKYATALENEECKQQIRSKSTLPYYISGSASNSNLHSAKFFTEEQQIEGGEQSLISYNNYTSPISKRLSKHGRALSFTRLSDALPPGSLTNVDGHDSRRSSKKYSSMSNCLNSSKNHKRYPNSSVLQKSRYNYNQKTVVSRGVTGDGRERNKKRKGNFLETITVVNIYKTFVTKIIEVVMEECNTHKHFCDEIRVQCTSTQLFWIVGKGWGCSEPKTRMAMKKKSLEILNGGLPRPMTHNSNDAVHMLKPGVRLLTISGGKLRVVSVKVHKCPNYISLYSIVVDKNHSFFANDVLVKNGMS